MKYVIPINLVELESSNYHLTIGCVFSNGTEGLWVIDSGASKTVFDNARIDLYKTLEKEEHIQIQSAGIGAVRFDTSLGELMPFSIGRYSVGTLQVALIDLSHINKLYFQTTQKEICGLIGSDFLLERKAVIDYGKLELVMEG